MKKLILLILAIVAMSSSYSQNNALDFDGNSDYVLIPSSSTLNVQDFTLECYAKMTSGGCLVMRANNSGHNEMNLWPRTSNIIKVLINNSEYSFGFPNDFNDDNWHHFAATYNSSQLKCYVDGVSSTDVHTVSAVLDFGSSNMLFGADYDSYNGTPNDFFNGSIDEVRLWNFAKSQAEIQSLMHSELTGSELGLAGYWNCNESSGNTLQDATSNQNDGTLYGDASFISSSAPLTQTGAQSNSIAFDGNGDYMSIPAGSEWEFGYGDFTVAFWMTLDNINKVHNGLFARNDFQWMALEYNHDSDHKLNLWIDNNGSNYWEFNNMKPSKNDWIQGDWYHIAVVRSGNIIKIYIDGVESASSSYTGQTYNPASVPVYFGRSQLSNRFHEGKMDDIRIYNIAHTATEMQNIMHNELTGGELGLVGYWNCNESSGNIAYDATINQNHGTLFGDASFVSSGAPLSAPGGNLPFSPVSPTGLPYNIIITGLSIDGITPPQNTQIGVFDDTLCVGAINYASNGNMQLVAWEGDNSQGLPGFTQGDTMVFKIYTTWYSSIEIFEAIPIYAQGDGTFGNGSFSVLSLDISTGLVPNIEISDTLLNFNALEINTSLTKSFTISNNGNTNLNVSNISSSLSNFTTSKNSLFLLPNETDTIEVTFTPDQVASYQETLTITTDQPGQETILIALYGTGLPAATPQISVTPSALNYGNIAVNSMASLNINVSNFGNGDLSVTNITSSNPAFSVIGNTSFNLAQNGNQDIEIQFNPTSIGNYNGSITVYSNDGNISIPLSGFATDGHFTSVQPTGLPYNIIVDNATVQGFNVGFDDEIAVFDDTLCVGVSSAVSGKSARFDGSGDYIQIPDDANWDFGTGDFSVSFWAKPASFSSNNTYIEIGHWSNSIIIRQNNSGSFYVYMWNNSYSFSYAPTLNQWFHVSVRRLNGVLNLFINGYQTGNSYSCGHNFQPSNVVRIGSSVHTTGQYFNGNIDEVRIWNHARSQSEIQNDMMNGLSGNETGLIGYWNFDNGNAADLTQYNNHGTFYGNTFIQNESPIPATHSIIAWEEDQSLGLPGFTDGDTMNFKIWTNIYNTDVEVDATAIYSIGNGTFGYGQFSVLSLFADAGIEPDIALSSNYIYVGQVEMNQSVTEELIIFNSGNAPLEVSLSDNSASYTHDVNNSLIDAGDSLIVTLTFSPTFAGNHSGVLTIISDDPDAGELTVSLDGFALPVGTANGTVSANNLDFGNILLGDTANLSFSVINIGTAPLQITNITSSNGAFWANPNNFTLQNTNDNQEVFISFAPTSVQQYSSTITVSTSAGNLTLSASGMGFDGFFDPVESTGLPYTVIIQNTNLSNFWELGDEIAVFDDTVCVGVAAISSLSGSIQLTCWEADAGQSLPGFTTGNQMTFKAWTFINGFESVFDANATFVVGDGTFGYAQYSVVELDFITPDISATPLEFFVALDEPDSTIENMTISSIGPADLNYEIVQDYNFTEDFEEDLSNWTLNGSWGLDTDSYEGMYCLSESPSGNYGNNTNKSIELTEALKVYDAANCNFSFMFKRSMECCCDYFRAKIQVNAGSWQQLGYWNCSGGWTNVSYNLSSYLNNGDSLKIRFEFTSDYSVTSNGAFVDNILITGINNSHDWLSISPISGVLSPQQNQLVNLNFNSTGLIDNIYYTEIHVISNSLTNSPITIPVTLNVTGNAQIATNPDSLIFSEIIVGETEILSLTIQNIGTDILYIDSIFNLLPEFEVLNLSSFVDSIQPLQSTSIDIEFSPMSDGLFLDSLFIISDASNEDTLIIPLSGIGLTPPEIAISKNYWTDTLNYGDIVTDTFYIRNEGQATLSYTVDNITSWLSVDPAVGSVAVSDSLEVILTISTLGVYAGDYSGIFHINSNDLTDPVLDFNLDLTVIGQPDISAIGNIDFGTVDVGNYGLYELIIENIGSDILNVDTLTFTSPYFSASGQTSFTVQPGTQDTVELLFIPSGATTYNGILSIFSNAVSFTEFPIVLVGTGNLPPDISYSPDTIDISIASGNIYNSNISVSNVGGQNLNYNFDIENAAGKMLNLDGNGDYLNVINSPELNPDTALTIEAWINPNDDNNEFIVAKEYSAVGTYRLWINESGHLQFMLNNSKTIASNTSISTNTWTHIAASFDGSEIQLFINGVLDYSFKWHPFSLSSNAANLRIGRSFNNKYFDGFIDELRIWDVARNESEIQSAMYQSMRSDETGLVLYYKFNGSGNVAQDFTGGNNGTFYGNSTRSASTLVFEDFISISPMNGNIAGGGSSVSAFEFDATGIFANTFETSIQISSNDPDESQIYIPVYLEVGGQGNIMASANSFVFNDTYLGLADTVYLTLSNTGAESIIISDWTYTNSIFAASVHYSEIYPYSEKEIELIFTPLVSGSFTDTLTISSDASNIPDLEIIFDAVALDPPIASFSSLSISESLNWSQTSTQDLWIKNDGDGPLNWSCPDNFPQWLSLSDTLGTVSAHDSASVTVSFDATFDGGDYSFSTIFSSNDYLNPDVSIQFSLHVDGAILSASTTAIEEYLTYQETNSDTFIIENTGVGPLDYTISESAAWLSLSSTSGSVAPASAVTIVAFYDGNHPHGDYQETIQISTNDPVTPIFNITVDLHILHATLVSIPGTLDFGYSVKNIGETLPLTILNNGNVTINIDSIYTVDPYIIGSNFAGTTLLAGESFVIDVQFLPNALIIFNEFLHVVTDIGTFDIALHGIGEQPNAAWHWTWSEYDFGLVDVAVGATRNITVSNWGNIPFTVDDWDVSSPYFTVSDTTFTVPVGGSRTITVGFNPDAIDIYEGTILYTSNDIGTKEILVDGRGFFLSDAPVLTYVDDTYFNGSDGVYPLIGSSTTFFEYKVIYTDADNHKPMVGYPIVGLDRNGDGDFLDSGEDEIEMTEVDATDTNYVDGKLYSFATTLPLNQLLGYSFFAYDTLGNPSIGEGVNYRSDPTVSNDFLDLSIYANDIQFSDLTPAVGQEITITATVHNNSDYPASNVSVKFYEEDSFIVELWIPYLNGQSSSQVSINHVFPIDEYYPIKVVVDEQNFINEDNELNNFAIRPVVVGEFSVPGAIVVTANVSPYHASLYGTMHYYGHADYVNSYDPNANVTGATVTMTVAQTGATYTTYTDANGNFDIWFTAPGAYGSYTCVGSVTDYTLVGNAPNAYFVIQEPASDPPQGPDLAITYPWYTDIHWTSDCQIVGDTIDVTAIVTNIGNQTAYDALVHVFKDNIHILSPFYDSIPAGTNKIIEFQVVYTTVGYHSVSVDIDPYNTINELAEWNNYGSKSRYIYPEEPDLSPTDIWFSDNSPLENQPVNMSFRIHNNGCTWSDTTSADIYHIWGTDTIFLSREFLPQVTSLSWQQVYLYNQTFTGPGWHYIMIVVDPDNTVAEYNENNNVYIEGFLVEQAISDLYISDISFSAYNPNIGDLINFTATIWNNGTADAYDFYVRYYIDGTQLSDSIHIAHLPIGTNMLITSDPWEVEDCYHTVIATVDEDDLIPETNEYNNSTSRQIGWDFAPSLWPYYYSSHINVLVGQTVTLKSRIYNNGTLDADTVFVSYLVDGVLAAYDGVPLINHQSYASSQILHTFQYTGDYVVKIWADMLYPDSTRYCEWDEMNNWVYLYVHVYGEDPDLEVLSHYISPTELNPDPDEYVNVYASFTNNGNVPSGPFWVKFYANSVQLGDSVYVPNLLAHEDSTVACTDSFASPLVGTHVFRVAVDENNQVPEYNELNNDASRAIIVGDAPDMMFSDAGGIWLSDTFPDIGDQIVINAVIENNGGATGTANLNFYVVFDGDSLLINTTQFTAAPYDSIDVPINWTSSVPYGTIVARISNCNPQEFNTFNNTAFLDFGSPLSPILVDITESTDTVCIGDTLSLYASASGGVESFVYTWYEGQNIIGTGANISLVPTYTTVYSVNASDGFHDATTSITIFVNDISVNLGGDISVCGGSQVVLDAGNHFNYLWQDQSTLDTLIVSSAGTYSVTVSDSYGCEASDEITVGFYDLPEPNLGNDTSFCDGESVVLNPGAFNSYIWQDQSTDQTLNVSDNGTYIAFVTDQNGCTNSDTIEISVLPVPQISLNTNIDLCMGDSVELSASAGYTNYLWSTQETGSSIWIDDGGIYYLTVTNIDGCSTNDSSVVTMHNLPEPDLSGTLNLCAGDSIELMPGLFASYLWNNQSTNSTLMVTIGETYSITVTDQYGCIGTGSVEVLEHALPTVDLGNDTTICEGVSMILDAGNFTSYFWNNQSTNAQISVSQTGTYSVTVMDNNACQNSDDVDVTVVPIALNLQSEYHDCEGEIVTISPVGDFATYLWSDSSTDSILSTSQSGVYSLTVSNEFGCEVSGQTEVIIHALPYLNLPEQAQICDGETYTVSAGNFTNYLWSNGFNGDMLSTNIAGIFSVTVSDQWTCENSDTVEVIVNPLPQLDIAGLDDKYCLDDVGDTLFGYPSGGTFTGTGVYGNYFYPGNSNPGTYPITYTYTDQNTCTNELSIDVEILALPIVTFLGLENEYYVNDVSDTLTGFPAGGTFDGMGISGNTFDPATAGIGNHTITYVYTDSNSCTNFAEQTTLVTSVFVVSGVNYYDNIEGEFLANSTIYLLQQNGSVFDSTTSDAVGYFEFDQVPNGMYYFNVVPAEAFDGVNATDALLVRKHVVQLEMLADLPLMAADVNASETISSLDALYVLRRTVNLINYFPSGDWVFDNSGFEVDNSDLTVDIPMLCYGDVNASNSISQSKSQSLGIESFISSTIPVFDGEIITIPVEAGESMEPGAITLNLSYPAEAMEILSVNSDFEDLLYNIENNQIKIAWSGTDGVMLNEGDEILSLTIKAKNPLGMQHPNILIGSEFANTDAEILSDVKIGIPAIVTQEFNGFTLFPNYPNPFEISTTISFYLPEKAELSYNLKDVTGRTISEKLLGEFNSGRNSFELNSSTLNSGAYFISIEADNGTRKITHSQQLNVIKK